MEYQDYSAKKIFKMSLPIFMELLLQLLVGNVDQFMVSQYSQNSVAAIGNGNQIINIVIIVLNAMSIATTILITQSLGADDKKKITDVFNASVLFITLFSIIISFALIIFRYQIFEWLKVPEEILQETSNYTLIVGSMILIQGLYMTFTAVLKSYSLMKEVMFVSIIMNTINIIGNAVLINGIFRLGVTGAAISTDISKCIGLALMTYMLLKKTSIQIKIKNIVKLKIVTLKKLLFIGVPSGGEALSYNLSQFCIQKFINSFGTIVITTKVYCYMLANVAYVYSIAIAQATQIIIGYLIGSSNIDKINKKVWMTILISMAVSTTITTLIYFNSDFVFGIFTDNPEILSLGKKIIFIEIFLEIGRSVNIAMTKCLVAVGDVRFPVILCMISAWIIAVGFGYYLSIVQGYGLVGIWIAMAIDECLRGIVFVIRFKSNKWRKMVCESN